MAHFSQVFHKASDSLAPSGMQHEQELDSLPPMNAKQRRLSRANTSEEVRARRRRRKQRKREDEGKLSRNEKRLLRAQKLEAKRRKLEQLLEQKTVYANEQRKRAIYFWKKWSQKLQSDIECLQIHQIDKNNIQSLPQEQILGEGRFGECKKKLYRGRIVAVKYFRQSVTPLMVKKEAKLINSFDHPGLPFVYGISTNKKPYAMVIEFYGIDGKSITVAKAARTNLLKNQKNWAESLWHCSQAIAYLHERQYIHCDIKGDNIVFYAKEEKYIPVLIDFGKMKKTSDAKKYNLSLKEQENYRARHKHVAPEVVRGTHPHSAASDVYGFGLILSLVCHNNKYEELRIIAVKCIHGTPHKRPEMECITSQLFAIFS